MPVLLLSVIRFVRLLLSGHQAVAIENAALRLQLAAFRRKRKRPVLTSIGCSGSVCLAFGATGAARCSTYRPTQSLGGSGSVFASSGRGCRGGSAGTVADPRLPSTFAD